MDILFHLLAAFVVTSALGVVFNRNAVAAAMCLLLTLLGVAGVFVLLDAFLLAALMVFVYAGAVVALFLFIIMLLDAQGGSRKPFKLIRWISTGVVGLLLLAGLAMFSYESSNQINSQSDASVTPVVGASLREYGVMLFTTYLLPVQIVGFLLLIAMLGVIVLSKRFEGLEDIK